MSTSVPTSVPTDAPPGVFIDVLTNVPPMAPFIFLREIVDNDPIIRGVEIPFEDRRKLSMRAVAARIHIYRLLEQWLSLNPPMLERLESLKTKPRLTKPIEKVCIIGAGVSGLYAAMILEDLGIPYEIYEADSRMGGRILTHRFNGTFGFAAPIGDPARYDYFDVGAMRFPDLPWMGRVFNLFQMIGVHTSLVPYNLSHNNNYMYFNDRHTTALNAAAAVDPFHYSVANGGNVPNLFTNLPGAVDHFIDLVYGPFKRMFANVYQLPEIARPAAFQAAWAALTAHDHLSTRSLMRTIGYPESVIEWLETFDAATGLYNQGFVESVLDSLDFDWPNPQALPLPHGFPIQWHCIDGGADRIIHAMVAQIDITRRPLLGRRVTRIAETDNPANPMLVEWTDKAGKKQQSQYSHVICTAPLGCVANIDLTGANLLFGQKAAIRTLHYDASTKFGLKFETRWWEDPGFMGGNQFIGGQSKTDLPIRVCVYPSYGQNVPPGNPPPVHPPPGVMIASYTWAQDALRIGSLCQNTDPRADTILLEKVLEDIVKLHDITPQTLPPVVDYHAYNWYDNPHARGAFALFGPGQFGHWPAPNIPAPQPPASSFASMKAPAAHGRLHFAGEATSIHHAWILGSLNSAWRAVYNMLDGQPALRLQLIQNWGIPDEETEIGLDLLWEAAQLGLL